MSAMASQITGVSIVYPTVCSGVVQRKHQSSASLAFVRGIHRCPVNFPHKGPVTRKMFPFDYVIMGRDKCTLTHWHRNNMGTILQIVFTKLFSWMKMILHWFKFHWNLPPMVQIMINHPWLRWTEQAASHGLNQIKSIFLTHIYGSVVLDDLTQRTNLFIHVAVKFCTISLGSVIMY